MSRCVIVHYTLPVKGFTINQCTDQLAINSLDFKILSTNTFYCQQLLCVTTQVQLTKIFIARGGHASLTFS